MEGNDLKFCLMFEYPDPKRRAIQLKKLGNTYTFQVVFIEYEGGAEGHVFLEFEGEKIRATDSSGEESPEINPRTTEDGKTSAVHFLQFKFSQQQKEAFLSLKSAVTLSVDHPNYNHSTKLNNVVVKQIQTDLVDERIQ